MSRSISCPTWAYAAAIAALVSGSGASVAIQGIYICPRAYALRHPPNRQPVKHAQGWHLEQPEPGVLVRRTPAGRTYDTTPTQYTSW